VYSISSDQPCPGCAQYMQISFSTQQEFVGEARSGEKAATRPHFPSSPMNSYPRGD
jgi:hypothetical protein